MKCQYLLTLAVILGGCAAETAPPLGGHLRTLDSRDQFNVDATVDAWLEHGFPMPDKCVDMLENLKIAYLPEEDWACSPGHAGCAIFSGRYPTILVRGVYADGCNDIVRHETLHHLEHCNWPYRDGSHAASNIWVDLMDELYRDGVTNHGRQHGSCDNAYGTEAVE